MEHVYYEPITKLSTIRLSSLLSAANSAWPARLGTMWLWWLQWLVGTRTANVLASAICQVAQNTKEFPGSSLIIIHLYMIFRPLLLEDHLIPALDNSKQNSTSKLNRNLELLGNQRH